jgi:hypothetical protein
VYSPEILSIEVREGLHVQLQSVLRLTPVAAAGDKPADLNQTAFAEPRGQPDPCVSGQNQRDTRFHCPGHPGLFLPGAVFKPEPLPCYTTWGTTNRFDGNHLTGQHTLVLH